MSVSTEVLGIFKEPRSTSIGETFLSVESEMQQLCAAPKKCGVNFISQNSVLH